MTAMEEEQEAGQEAGPACHGVLGKLGQLVHTLLFLVLTLCSMFNI